MTLSREEDVGGISVIRTSSVESIAVRVEVGAERAGSMDAVPMEAVAIHGEVAREREGPGGRELSEVRLVIPMCLPLGHHQQQLLQQ